MDINRNQWFLGGVVILLMGGQFHLVDSFVLTSEATSFLAERTGHPLAAVNASTGILTPDHKPIARKPVHPPEWVGWLLVSVGSVLILHSWGMKKPG